MEDTEGEIRHLFRMWKQLSDTWQAISDMRVLSWASVNCKNVRASLESALEELSGKISKWSPFIISSRPPDRYSALCSFL